MRALSMIRPKPSSSSKVALPFSLLLRYAVGKVRFPGSSPGHNLFDLSAKSAVTD